MKRLLLGFFVAAYAVFSVGMVVSAASAPNIISYQGRLLNTAGVPVADASASMVFKLYDDPTAGSCVWSNSSSTCASATTRTVTLTGGLFTENLGDTTLGSPYAAIPDSIFANNASLYLEVTINAETLSPRKQIVSAPYALNSDSLDGLDSTTTGATSSMIPALNSSGALVITGTPGGSGVSNGSLYVNPAAASADNTIFGIADNGTDRFRVDKEGDVYIGGTRLQGGTGTSHGTSGATIVGVFPEFSYSSSSNVQSVLKDLDTAIGTITGGASFWTDAVTYTYLTAAGEDLVLGGNSPATGTFFFDESAGQLFLGTDGSLNGSMTLYSTAATDPALSTDGSGNLNVAAAQYILQDGSGNTLASVVDDGTTGHVTSTGSFLAAAASGIDTSAAGALTIGNTTATSVSECNSAACDTWSVGTNADADTLSIGDSSDTTSITGATWSIASTGVQTMSATGAQTTAIVVTDTDYTNALSVGDNNITGTTYSIVGTGAAIDFSNFDVASSGAITVAAGTGLDTNGAGALALGNTNATSTTICNSAACDTVTIGTNADADTITIGDSLDTTAINGSAWSVSSGGAATFSSIAATSFSGDINMGNHIITNIGNAGTDFGTDGSLTLAGALEGSTGTILVGSTTPLVQLCNSATCDDIYLGTTTDADNIFIGDVSANDSVTVTSANWSIGSNGAATFGGTLTGNGTVALGDGGDTVTINSSDWDISAVGNMSNIGTIDADGNITTSADLAVNGGDITSSSVIFNLLDAALSSTTIEIGGVTTDLGNTVSIATNSSTADSITIGNTTSGTTTLLRGGAASAITFTDFSVATTGATTITPDSDVAGLTVTGTNVTSANLLSLDARNTTGTLANIAFGAATSQGAGTLTGVALDLKTNLTTPAAGRSVTGIDLSMPTISSTSNTTVYTGYGLTTVGNVTNGTAGSVTWNGTNVTTPNITQSSGGTVTVNGALVTTGSITTAGTQNGINVAATGVGAGTLNGVKVGNITGSSGTENALSVGSGWDSDISFVDTSPVIALAATTTSLIIKDTSTLFTFGDVAGSIGNFTASGSLNTGTGLIDTTSATSASLFNTNATAINMGGAASNINIGGAGLSDLELGGSAGAGTINIGGVGTDTASTVNIATEGTTADTITIGNSTAATAVVLRSGTWSMAAGGILSMNATSAQTNAIVVTDTDYTNALTIGDNNILGTTFSLIGTTAAIDFTNFDVGSNGAITVAAGVGLDTNGAGALAIGNTNATSTSICNSAACDTITMGTNADADTITIGDSSDTTSISGTDWNVSSSGVLSLTATGAQTTAIVATDTDYTNALSIGDNNITGTTYSLIGTTAQIDFSNFDVGTNGAITVAAGVGLDTNAAGALAIGNTNATSTSICNSAACDTIDIGTNADADTITMGDSLDTMTLSSVNWSIVGAGTATLAHNLTVGDTTGTDLFSFTSVGTTQTVATFDTSEISSGKGVKILRSDSSTNAFTGSLLDVEVLETSGAGRGINIINDTAPGYALYMTQDTVGAPSGTTPSNQMMVLDSNEAGGTDKTILIRSDADGTPDTEFSFDNSGTALADGAWTGGGADYAEYFLSNDSSLGSYDLVCVDGSANNSVKRCEPGETTVTGVISTNAGFIGNSLGAEFDPSSHAYDAYRLVGLTGQIESHVTADDGAIAIGDPLTVSSTLEGYAGKANSAANIVGYALEPMAAGRGTIKVLVQPRFYAGDILDSNGNVDTDGVTLAALTEATATSPAADSNALALVGSAWDGAAATDVGMSLSTHVTSSSNYRMSFKNEAGTEVAAVTNNGDLMIAGRLYPSDRGITQSSAYIYYDSSAGPGYMKTNAAGWSVGSYDFAEMFPSADLLTAGDVVTFGAAPQSVLKSTGTPYDSKIAGVVSTRPGFLAGDYVNGSYPIALSGRVPTHVSAENGAIAVGDPLTSSSKAGYAMKATEAGTIIGYAMEPLQSGEGTIVVFVRSGYYAGTGTNVAPAADNNVSQLSSNFSDLNVTGSLNMNGGNILSVNSISGLGGTWKVDSEGNFVTKGQLVQQVKSYQGELVDTYATTSTQVALQLSGTATLESGWAIVKFDDIDPKFKTIISSSAPYRVIATPSGITGQIYVTDRTSEGFIIHDSANSNGVAVDWLLMGYQKDHEPAPVVAAEPVPTPTTPDVLATDPTSPDVIAPDPIAQDVIADNGTDATGSTESAPSGEVAGDSSTSTTDTATDPLSLTPEPTIEPAVADSGTPVAPDAPAEPSL